MNMFESVFMGAMTAAENRVQQEEGRENDYIGENGLLMCGVCNEPLYLDIEVPMIGPRRVPRMCACARERAEMEETRKRIQEEQQRIDKLRKIGVTNDKYTEMTISRDDGAAPKLRAAVDRYIEMRDLMYRENIGLLFHGSTGGGKTFWAAAIANAMIDHGRSAIVTNFDQLLTAIRANYEAEKGRILGQFDEVEFLVLDELKFEGLSQYDERKIYEIINSRYLAHKPLIVTTNMTLEEITNPGTEERQRICDRIIEMCVQVHVSVEGRRMALAKKKSERAREILGI